MRMSRLLLSRIVVLSAAMLLVALALAVWQARRDVEHEAQGARQTARLLDALGGLHGAPADEIPRRLRAVQSILDSGEMRHLRVILRDEAGAVLAHSPDAAGPRLQAWLFAVLGGSADDEPSVHWTLRGGDGRRIEVEMAVDRASEQQEALDALFDLLAILLAFGTLVVLASVLTVRQVLSPLHGILHAIEGYRSQDYARRAPRGRSEEMNAIADGLNHLAQALAAAQEARRGLSARLLTLQEAERAHLARELHDEFGQVLTAMRADATWLARRVRGDATLEAVAGELVRQCERASLEVRDLLRRLRPALHETDAQVPLRRMLEELADSWRGRAGRPMAVELDLDAAVDALPAPLALALYRLSQEALTNAARHAQAVSVRIVLAREGDGRLRWEALDDGVGLRADGQEAIHGNGLVGMRERVWAHGGELAFLPADPDTGRGLRIRACFPLAEAVAEE
ncbi:sensor histidine kinase [Coralloluteibacterium thermophilus]|uniref:histidine kinase n=1 Tax=Coralloluteibacterium thermophilum TaxID=2707049 RepID=A0ABV9NJI3_9GAMM